ncbi:MAG: peptidoglycan-binding protein [Candidatus Pacebacteria bacterium]|nr:peptidoglycan-binding protein [Candidatus Paceibacterota bacterium]MBP9818842.1 peptidoglycan-binding protein [Candidatus Paceibacterota bacterium]
MYTSFKTFYKVTFITAIALAIVCGTFVSRGVQAQTTVGASVVDAPTTTVSSASSTKYQIVRPSAGETLTIGDSVAISWKRPARSPYSATLTLRLTPVPQKGEKLTPEFVFAVGVSGTAYKWVVPTRIIPGTYKITVVPSVGTWALSTSSTVTIKAKEVVKKQGTAKFNQYDPAALFGETDQYGNTTSLETKFYMKITANGGPVKMPKQSDFEIEFGNGKPVTNCSLKLNRNLVLGSTGVDVVELQNFLESKGLLTMAPGVAKGYFAATTKTAVAKYQVSKGITPADGYVSPITRASMMADCGSNTIVTPATEIVPIKASSIALSADSYEDLQNNESRNFTVKGRANVAGAPTGLYTATLRIKNAGGVEEYPAQIYVNVVNTSTKVPVLRISNLLDPIRQTTYVVDSRNTIGNVPFNGVTVRGEGSTSTINSVTVKFNRIGSSTIPAVLALKGNNGVSYSSKVISGDGKIVFDNLNLTVFKDRLVDLIAVGDMPLDTVPGSAMSVDIVGVTTQTGTVLSDITLPLIGEKISFVATSNYDGVPTYSQNGQASIVKVSNAKDETTALTASFPLKVWAVGGSILKPQASNFRVVFVNASSTVSAIVGAPVVIPNTSSIAASSTASVTVTATVAGNQLYAGIYSARLVDIKTFNGIAEYSTPGISVNPPPRLAITSMLSASVGIALRMVFGSVVSLFGY